MNHVFTRKLEDRPVVSLNSDFQPYSRKDKVVTELSSFLGTIARLYIPLDFVNWSKVPEEEKKWLVGICQGKKLYFFFIIVLFFFTIFVK